MMKLPKDQETHVEAIGEHRRIWCSHSLFPQSTTNHCSLVGKKNPFNLPSSPRGEKKEGGNLINKLAGNRYIIIIDPDIDKNISVK